MESGLLESIIIIINIIFYVKTNQSEKVSTQILSFTFSCEII